MSWNPGIESHCPQTGELEAIETQIIPRALDLGGFEVRCRRRPADGWPLHLLRPDGGPLSF